MQDLAPVGPPQPVQLMQSESPIYVPQNEGLQPLKVMVPPPVQQHKFGGMNHNTTKPPVQRETWQPAPRKEITPIPSPFDHEIIGGKITICVLLYGNYPDLHKQCIGAILATVPKERRELRVAANEVCAESLEFVRGLKAEGQIYKLYENGNIKKYPAMRQMFHDPEDPITTRWLVWFDDDSIANKDLSWCTKLMHAIIDAHPRGVRLLGAPFVWTFDAYQIAWLKSRPWYKGRPWQLRNGQEAPNGKMIHFAAGGFWAMETKAMREANVPDPQIGHNGGDYQIAAQIFQQGYSMKAWNTGKALVNTSATARRGLSEHHTGTKDWVPGGNSK